MKKCAGVLFALDEPFSQKEILLARRREKLGDYRSGQLLFAGGTAEAHETDMLEVAFRETREEWCGHLKEVEDFFRTCLPGGFRRRQVREQVYRDTYGDWEFHTYLVRLTAKFDPKKLKLNGEFEPGSGIWVAVDQVNEFGRVAGTVYRAIEHFKLRNEDSLS